MEKRQEDAADLLKIIFKHLLFVPKMSFISY